MFGESLFDECLELVEKWKPQQKYLNEGDYKRDLRQFLFTNLNKSNMISGERHINVKEEDTRSLCDIGIEREVGIELKFGKEGKIKDIDRLQGQVEKYRLEYSKGVIVVLVGDVSDYTEAQIRENLTRLLHMINTGFGTQFNIKLRNKSHSKTGTRKQPPKDNGGFGDDSILSGNTGILDDTKILGNGWGSLGDLI